jgi:hypothetical protein
MSAEGINFDNFYYVSFVKGGKQWHLVESGMDQYMVKYMLSNEPVIEEATGKSYFKFYRSVGDMAAVYDVGLVREEDHKVYFYDTDAKKEFLMFDFSLKEGDTYETYSYEYQQMVKYKVWSVEDYTEGPEMIHYIYDQTTDSWIAQRRYLRKWVVSSTLDDELCMAPKVWIEGVGSLGGPLGNFYDVAPVSSISYLAYVDHIHGEVYLPFSFYDTIKGGIHGSDVPKGGRFTNSGNKGDNRLIYELEGRNLHVYGKIFTQCGPNNYAYFYEKSTDDPMVHRIEVEIQEVEPIADCASFESTDFYVPGFDPNMNYIVVDNYGEEHTVIKKTKHFPEGTKWTEIRLDTLKYDSWYSKVGNEWVPNFETIEYYVDGNYSDRDMTFRKVFTNGPEWTDSLTLLIQEADNTISVSPWVHNYEGTSGSLWPGEIYQFDWNVGKGLYYEDILLSNTTTEYPYHYYYGIIDEIKEGQFGGVRPLKYVDLDGKAPVNPQEPGNRDTNGGRIIQGIGVTEWNDGECLFGPPAPYHALSMYDNYQHPERHYRSMLVHFERNGEVLYDMMPDILPQNEYRPFVEDGKVWTVREYPDYPPFEQLTVNYYFDGDTIVDGKTCKRMMYVINANEEWVDGVFTPGNLPKYYDGAYYELDKKVYYANNGYQQLRLLYDFTLSTDDIVDFSYPLVVNKVSGSIPGFKGTYYEFWHDGQLMNRWLEGVGSESLPYLDYPWAYVGGGGTLLTCRVGDEVIYYSGVEDDPYGMGAQKRRFDFTHTTKLQPKAPMMRDAESSLYGEYNEQQLDINLDPLEEAYQVRITDETGKVVYEKAINAGSIVGLNIDISNYAKGRYTVTVENSQEVFTGEFEAQATGIEEVNLTPVLSKGEGTIFNLQGQRLSSLQRGLNIVNGQKVYVK